MGSYITKLKSDCEHIEILNISILKSCSLFKLKEYQANFQMVCESFSINFTEFEQIFGMFPNQNEFYIWDTDTNGLIDSFELYSGLFLFADCATEEKIAIIFELFDFNHVKSIAFFDLCYLIESCISACFKMHKVGTPVASKDLEDYLSSYFFRGGRVTLNNFIWFITESNEVKQFFALFKISPIMTKDKFNIGFKVKKDFYQDFLNQINNDINDNKFILSALEPNYIISNSRFDKYRMVIQNATKRLTYHRSIEKPQMYNNASIDYNLKLKWVYGIRINDIKKPCQYLNGGLYSISTGSMNYKAKEAAINSIIIYFIGKIVVLLYVSFNKQRFYLSHENEVISAAPSVKNGEYIASGEQAQRPAIHIWNSQSLETLAVLKGHHLNGIHLLSFTNDDNFLISCGRSPTFPILIHEWRRNHIVFSFMLNNVAQDINLISFSFGEEEEKSSMNPNLQQETLDNEKPNIYCSIICSIKEVAIIQIKEGSVKKYYVPFTKDFENKEIISILSIKGDANYVEKNGLLMMSNTLKCSNYVLLIGFIDGDLYLFSTTSMISKY